MIPDDPFNSRITPRHTWFHKDPEIALSELVMGGYRRVEEWRAPSMIEAMWKAEYLRKAVELYESHYLIIDPRGTRAR
jgi:hypothetical protein